MKHAYRVLVVAASVAAAAASSILATPAARDFLEHHPAVATYIALATGALAAGWRVLKEQTKPKP